jgi:hypothetical protein
MEKIMEENQKSSLFTELTDSEAESLSGGKFWRTFGRVATGIGAAVFTGAAAVAAVTGVGLPLAVPLASWGVAMAGAAIADNNGGL